MIGNHLCEGLFDQGYPFPFIHARPSLPDDKIKKSGQRPLFRDFSTCSARRQGADAQLGNHEIAPDGAGLFVARLLVGSLDPGIVDQAGDRLAVANMGLEDLLQVRLLHAAIPDVVRVNDHHRTVAALRKAAGLVDPDIGLQAGLDGLVPEILHELLDVALSRTRVAGRAHEDVGTVLSHHSASTTAVFAALRSAMNLSTSSRIVSPIPSERSAPRPIADLIVPTPGVPASVTPRWNA